MFKSWNLRVEAPAATASSKPGRRLDLPLAATAACIVVMLTAPIIGANPTGGKVVRGNANINTHQPGQVTIHQHSGKAVINWNGFSIEKGEVTEFDQPGKRSIALNRVVTNRPSRINGQLRANGNVWLINQNGVTIGRNGTVQAQGFLATTADIADDNFMAGRYQFDRPSPNPHAKVINRGHISLGERGLGALVAPHARNDGVIEGQGSTVVIAGAKTFAVDLYGDDLIHFETKSPVTRRPAGVEALAENNGIIQVDGGRVLITAVAAEGIVDQAIQIDGKIHARSVSTDGGEIVLDGGNHGTVAVTGTLDASSRHGRGGKIDIRGRKLRLGRKSLVKASGGAGGGDIRIGGDRGGQGPGRNADRVILAPEARIIADATGFGDGGSIIVYGQRTARIAGKLTARGGPAGGDGGFIETSAAGTIDIAAAQVDASAPAGNPGTWLIDPQDITIDAANASAIVTALEGGSNVEVTTADGTPPYGTGSSGPGNITVVASIRPDLTKNPNSTNQQNVTLTLTADNDVTINNGVTIGPTSADAGDRMGVTITAGNNITNNGIINVSLGAGAVNLTARGSVSGRFGGVELGRINAGTGDITVTATTGEITDNTAAEGAGNENLVGGTISLAAFSSIGGISDGEDIDTAADRIDAKITTGDPATIPFIVIAETDTVQLGNTEPIAVNASSDDEGVIEITAGGTMTVAQAVTARNLRLTATAGDLQINQAIASPSNVIQLNAAGQLNIAAAVSAKNWIELTGGTGITHTAAGDVSAGRFIRATATTGDITMADGTVYSTGERVTLTAEHDVRLGRIEAGTNAITVTATTGAIHDITGAEDENLVGGAIVLQAASGIGAIGEATDIDIVADSIDAEITGPTGDVSIAETGVVELGGTTQVAAGAEGGSIQVTAGDAMTVVQDVTTAGSGDIRLRTEAGDLQVNQAVTAGGELDLDAAGQLRTADGDALNVNDGGVLSAGGAVSLAARGGDIALGRVDAGSNAIAITAGGAISDYDTAAEGAGNENLIGGAITLQAAGGIGAAGNADIDTAVANISADTTDGGIDIDNALVSNVTVTNLTSGGTGDIRFDQSGGGAVTFGPVTTNNGAIALTNTDAGLSVSGPITAGGAGNAVNLDAAGLLHIAAAVSGSSVALTGGTGIEHTAAGDVTATSGTITATAAANDISMADGTVYRAEGDVTLIAANDVALGRIEAGIDNTIVVTATEGAISDNTVGEGAGNENLVCCNIILTAASGIGAPGEAADIDVTAGRIDTDAGSGGVYLAETDTLQCGEPTGPDTDGPDTTDPDPTVPDPTGPDTTGPDITGPDTTVPDPTGPDVTGSDILVSEPPRSEGIPDKTTEPEKIPNDTIVLQVLLFQETSDSRLQLTPGVFDSLADAYAIPDYEADDELYMVHLNGANEAIWEESGGHDDDGEEEE